MQEALVEVPIADLSPYDFVSIEAGISATRDCGFIFDGRPRRAFLGQLGSEIGGSTTSRFRRS
jgi:hypothetical protein